MFEDKFFHEQHKWVILGYMYATNPLYKDKKASSVLVEIHRLLALEVSAVLHYDLWDKYVNYLESKEFKDAVDKSVALRETPWNTFEERLPIVQRLFAGAMRKCSEELGGIYESDYYRKLSALLPRPAL